MRNPRSNIDFCSCAWDSLTMFDCGFLKSILNRGNGGNDSPEGLQSIKWGMASPLMLRLSGGAGSVRAFGAFSCPVSDPVKLMEEGCDIEDGNSVEQYGKYLTDLVVSSFRDVLGAESSSILSLEIDCVMNVTILNDNTVNMYSIHRVQPAAVLTAVKPPSIYIAGPGPDKCRICCVLI